MLKDDHAGDPQRSIVFTKRDEAARYVGKVGQTTLTFDLDQGVAEVRVHDGTTLGGILIYYGAIGSPDAVTAKVLNVTGITIPAETEETTITHELGYAPIVVVRDADGNVLAEGDDYVAEVTADTVVLHSVNAETYEDCTVYLR